MKETTHLLDPRFGGPGRRMIQEKKKGGGLRVEETGNGKKKRTGNEKNWGLGGGSGGGNGLRSGKAEKGKYRIPQDEASYP